MEKFEELDIMDRCYFVFEHCGQERERIDEEIKQAKQQLRKLNRERKENEICIDLYKKIQRRNYGA